MRHVVRMEAQPGWKRARIYSVGHSTRSLVAFIALLRSHDIKVVADVRSLPGSRAMPQFNREVLERMLPLAGIEYVHLPKLGGRRRTRKDSTNTGWRHPSFRGYADFMQTKEFSDGLEELRGVARRGPVALLCAEAVRWRCHRTLIADALFARGVIVQHIESATRVKPHEPTPFARFHGTEVGYPPPTEDRDEPAPAP